MHLRFAQRLDSTAVNGTDARESRACSRHRRVTEVSNA